MSTFNELQDIWQQAAPPMYPTAAEMLRLVRKSRRKIMIKVIVSTIALLVCIGVQVWVLFNFHPVYVTTRIGLLLMLLTAAGGVISNLQQLYLLQASASASDAATGLSYTLRYQQKIKRYFTTGMSVLFSMLSVGLLLYLYEFAHHTVLFTVCSYGFTFLYIIICWTVLRPWSIRRHTASVDKMISHLTQLKESWED